VRTKIAVLLSLLLSFAGALCVDTIDVRIDLHDIAQEEAAGVEDPDDYLTSNPSRAIRHRQLRRKLAVELPRGFNDRLEEFLTTGGTKRPFSSSQQKLYRLQAVFRI